WQGRSTARSILLALAGILARTRSRDYTGALGDREPAPLGPRCHLQRGPSPQPQGPRARKPLSPAQARPQHAALAPGQGLDQTQNQARRLGGCLPPQYARPNAIALPPCGGGRGGG